MKKTILLLLCTLSLSAKCVSDSSAYTKLLNRMSYSSMLPIKVAGEALSGSIDFGSKEVDLDTDVLPEGSLRYNKAVCKCPKKPIPQVGISFGMYHANKIVETTQDPFCLVGLGLSLDGLEEVTNRGSSHHSGTKKSMQSFYHAHYYYNPVWEVVKVFNDIGCIKPTNFLDGIYFSEVDPSWADDTLASFLQPDALLFNNPIAQLPCIADATSSLTPVGSLDPLYWCKGTWGSVFPLTGNVSDLGNIANSSSVAYNMIFKSFREFLTFNEAGPTAMCFNHPMPIPAKSSHRLQLVLPTYNAKAKRIGSSAIVYGAAKDIPFQKNSGNWAYIWFSKFDCCFL